MAVLKHRRKTARKNPAFSHSFLNWPPKIIRWNVSINSERVRRKEKVKHPRTLKNFISSNFSLPPSPFARDCEKYEFQPRFSTAQRLEPAEKKTKILCIINYSQTPLKWLCWRRSFHPQTLPLRLVYIYVILCLHKRSSRRQRQWQRQQHQWRKSQQKCKNKNILVRMGGWEKRSMGVGR